MVDVIRVLRREHRDLTRLLDLLAREVNIMGRGGTPDLELVRSVLHYILNFPDLFHHPKEDLVLAHLRRRDAAAAAAVGDLEDEHERLTALSRHMSSAVGDLVDGSGGAAPRGRFLGAAGTYLTLMREHMQKEEVTFFPAALRALEPADWDAIDAALEAPDDPLFGTSIAARYDALHARIMQWTALAAEPL